MLQQNIQPIRSCQVNHVKSMAGQPYQVGGTEIGNGVAEHSSCTAMSGQPCQVDGTEMADGVAEHSAKSHQTTQDIFHNPTRDLKPLQLVYTCSHHTAGGT